MGTALQTIFLDEDTQNRHPWQLDGSALCQAAFEDGSVLNTISDNLSVHRVAKFYAESVQESFNKIGEEVPDDMDPSAGLAWFEPKLGLAAVEPLLQSADLVSSSPDVIEDLKQLKAELDFAAQNRTLFRLVMSF